jgi:hypothetical protein
MTQTRRVRKGGAATPDIFIDPFVEKEPPSGHETFTKENSQSIKDTIQLYKNINKNTESFSEFYKRILKYFYEKWKKTTPLPDPLDGTLQINEEELKEMQEYIYEVERKEPNKSRNTIIKEFLSNIFDKENFDEIKEDVLEIESEGKRLSTGKIATGQGGEADRLLQIFMISLKGIDSIEEIPLDRTSAQVFLANKNKGEVVNAETPLLYDSLVNLTIDTYSPHPQEKETFLLSSKIIFKKDTAIGSFLSRTQGNIIPLPAVYLIEKEYLKEAWKNNDISSFTKNVGDYMRSFKDSLDIWNTSKWTVLADSTALQNIYLWHERFLILDKTPFTSAKQRLSLPYGAELGGPGWEEQFQPLPPQVEYINLLDLETKENETEEEKQKFFEELRIEIENLRVSKDKEILKKIRIKLKTQQFLTNIYERIKDQRVLLMDPETIIFLYEKTPSLWETTGLKQYEDDMPEQNLKMIFLLQYVRILADFEKKKKNKFSAVKSYRGIDLLKDNLHDMKIQKEIIDFLEKNDEAWERVKEKEIYLYPGFEPPIQTIDSLKGFLANIKKPLTLNEINVEDELTKLGEEAEGEGEEGAEGEAAEGEGEEGAEGEGEEGQEGAEEGAEGEGKEGAEEGQEEAEGEEDEKPGEQTNIDYFDPTTSTFPNLEKQIVTKYPDAKGGAEEIEEDPHSLKLQDVVQIRSVKTSGNKNDCLIHAFLLDMSPAFRRLNMQHKNEFADQYRREVFPTFYTEEQKADKLNDFNLIQSESYLNDRHAVKLADTFKINILLFENLDPKGYKITANKWDYKFINRPYIIIYNPDNAHFRAVQNIKSKKFLFTNEEAEALSKKYKQETQATNNALKAVREKERASQVLKQIQHIIDSENKLVNENILLQFKDAEEQYKILDKISNSLANTKIQRTPDQKAQMLADAKKAAETAEAALAQVKKISESAVVPAQAPPTQGGRRKYKITRKKNRSTIDHATRRHKQLPRNK